MKKYEKHNIDATDENIKKAIINNEYGRANSIKNFIEGLDLIDANLFISLDARWGEGKTFYIRQVEMTLRYLSEIKLSGVSDLKEVFSKSELGNIEIQKTYLPIYYNSWLYDSHNDPLMSLLYVIVKECGKYISTSIDTKSISDKLLSLFSTLSLFSHHIQISSNFEKIKEDFVGKDILEEIKTAEEIRNIVKQILGDVITESAQKLVIFIDELDRCKPSYAIEMLERIKHYFDDERIIFVVSVNKEQLVHTISKFYGDAFDSTGYLNKFFDINLYLPPIPDYLKGNSILQTNNNQHFLEQFTEELSEYYSLSLRDHIIFQQNIETTSKQHYNDYSAQGCILSILIPIMIVLDIVSQEEKSDFMKGQNEIFKRLCEDIPSLHRMVCRFGNNSEYDEENYQIGFKKLNDMYECAFGKKGAYDGPLDVERDLKSMCIKICNGN